MTDDAKPSNPKDAIGVDKLPLDIVPGPALAYMALGLLDGALKYGRVNWRAVGIRSSVYIAAMQRHLDALKEGEDNDPVTGVPHLAYILAGAAIYVDALEAGNLLDDRAMPVPGGRYRAMMTRLTAFVPKLRDLYADRVPPKHYTTADAPRPPATDVPGNDAAVKCDKRGGCSFPRVCDKRRLCLFDVPAVSK